MSNAKVFAAAAVAIVGIVVLFGRKEEKPAAQPQYRKLNRGEAYSKVMDHMRSQGHSEDYMNAMDIMGKTVDFDKVVPLYERVN